MATVQWLDDVELHDYDAARQYLTLTVQPAYAAATVEHLMLQHITSYCAKDIIRASGLKVLRPDNFHVNKDILKVKAGKKLSPILLVRKSPHLIIADGYHRVCAAYHLNENSRIPCKISNLMTYHPYPHVRESGDAG
jgi:hypothetical protein